MRLLLTGPEPFGGESVNPSGEVVRALEADTPPDVELTTMIFAVHFRSVANRVLPALDSGAHDAWLGVGEAGSRPHVSVERIGIDVFVDAALPVSQRDEVPIREDGLDDYFARMPLQELASTMRDARVPTIVSNTAETYCCNESLPTVQHHLAETRGAIPSGFIHLPYLPDQVANKLAGTLLMALATQLLGIRTAIEAMRELVAAVTPELARA
jgi:pyroglutamyl-peptidase